jgi:hypothetical protein
MAVQSVQSTNAGIRRRQLFRGLTIFLGFDGPTVTIVTTNPTQSDFSSHFTKICKAFTVGGSIPDYTK